MATFRFQGSLTQAAQATKRNIRRHNAASVRTWADAYYQSARGKRPGVPVLTGATKNSLTPWVGRERFRRVPRGPIYPPPPTTAVNRAMQRWRLGQRFGISTQHPGGLLARGGRFRRGPRAGQLISKKAPFGYHKPAVAAAEAAYRALRFKPEARG